MVRCAATSKSGTRCKNETKERFPYCWIHLKSIEGLSVKPSNINRAGKGLYAEKEFKKNEKIIDYTGKAIIGQPENGEGDYKLHHTTGDPATGRGRVIIDAEDKTSSSVARYANHCRAQNIRAGECKENNAAFNKQGKKGVYKIPLKAKKKIKKGQEIFVSYGRSYWESSGHKSK